MIAVMNAVTGDIMPMTVLAIIVQKEELAIHAEDLDHIQEATQGAGVGTVVETPVRRAGAEVLMLIDQDLDLDLHLPSLALALVRPVQTPTEAGNPLKLISVTVDF